MENYQIIKAYLETFPDSITAKEMIENITKAEEQHAENLKKVLETMKKNIGKVYFYRDDDDCETREMTRIITKISGVTKCYCEYMYVVDTLEISDGLISYMNDVQLRPDSLDGCKEINASLFDMLLEKYNALQSVDF